MSYSLGNKRSIVNFFKEAECEIDIYEDEMYIYNSIKSGNSGVEILKESVDDDGVKVLRIKGLTKRVCEVVEQLQSSREEDHICNSIICTARDFKFYGEPDPYDKSTAE